MYMSEHNLRAALFEAVSVDTQSVLRKQETLRKMSFMASAMVAVIAALALIGWGLDRPMLTSWTADSAAMKVNTALALLSAALSLALQREKCGKRFKIGKFLAAITLLIAMLTLLEYGAGID